MVHAHEMVPEMFNFQRMAFRLPAHLGMWRRMALIASVTLTR